MEIDKNEMKNEGARVEQNRVFPAKFEGMRLLCFWNEVVISSSFRDEVHRNLVRLISKDRLIAIIDSLQSFGHRIILDPRYSQIFEK